MDTYSGREVISAIERLLEKQAQDAQETKQISTIRLASGFASKNNIPTQSGAVATISRIVRKLDDEGIRQIRSLSDSLLNRDEDDLRSELTDLKDKLSHLEARVHQVKTRSAFVATALRPFSKKYASRWFTERKDIDVVALQRRVAELEGTEIRTISDMTPWLREVSKLFEALVIYRGSDAQDYYTRPPGTVNERSSRTYIQSWLSFTEKFKEEIWSLVTGGELREEYDFKLSRSQEFTYEKLVEDDVQYSSAEKVFALSAPPRPKKKVTTVSPSLAISSKRVSNHSDELDSIYIFIESKLDSTAQATRKWENLADFRNSLQKWLDTFPIIWGDASESFWAKVSVKNANGESDLTLPKLTVSDAAERLTTAVEMQLH
jgi:hypothetical protein